MLILEVLYFDYRYVVFGISIIVEYGAGINREMPIKMINKILLRRTTTLKTINNNLRMIGCVYKAAPMYLASTFLCSAIQAFLAVGGLWADRMVISRLMGGAGLAAGLFLFYGFYIALDYAAQQARLFLMNRFNSLLNVDLSLYMRRLLYEKGKELDLACYEDQECWPLPGPMPGTRRSSSSTSPTAPLTLSPNMRSSRS